MFRLRARSDAPGIFPVVSGRPTGGADRKTSTGRQVFLPRLGIASAACSRASRCGVNARLSYEASYPVWFATPTQPGSWVQVKATVGGDWQLGAVNPKPTGDTDSGAYWSAQ